MLFYSDVTVQLTPSLSLFSFQMLIRIIIILSEWAGLERGGGRQNVVISSFGMGLLSQLIKSFILLIKYTNHLRFYTRSIFIFKFSRLWQPEIFSLMLKWNSLAFFTQQSWWLSLPDSQEKENRHPSLRVFDNYAHDGCKNSIVWWMGLRLIFGVIISSMRGRHDALIIHFNTPIKFVIPWYSWTSLKG